MAAGMNLHLPAWTHDFPTESGTYLVTDEYGRISLLDVRSVSKDGLARCSDGTHILDATDWFCGPLKRDDLFAADVRESVEAAWAALPAKKLAAAEIERSKSKPAAPAATKGE